MNSAKMNSAERLHKGERELVEALAECLEALREGEPAVEACLRRYPDYEEQLRALLEVVRLIPRLPREVTPSERFREQTRAWVLRLAAVFPAVPPACEEPSSGL